MSPLESRVKALLEQANKAYKNGDEEQAAEHLYEIMRITGLIDTPLSE
jgi:phage shock protein A